MPAKGEIHVRVSSASAGATARWLRVTCLPHLRARANILLTPGHNAETCRDLEKFAAILTKASARKRPACHSFVVNIERQLVERFAGVVVHWPLPPDVAAVLVSMHEATRSRRGRPCLSDGVRIERLSKSYLMIEDRQRKRIKRQIRIDAAWRGWFDEVHERGETILTASRPTPKI